LLGVLTSDVVMIGLNISRPFSEPFRNFHDPRSQSQDYKIRHGFASTPFWGAYMTDLVKDTVEVDSASLFRSLTDALVRQSVSALREELRDLGATQPTIVAFGAAVHRLLASAGVPAVRLTHYSARVSKEAYREHVQETLGTDLFRWAGRGVAW
jgi:hypothetical protein